MNHPKELRAASRKIREQIKSLLIERPKPIAVTLDGDSGAGKSTLASIIASELDITLIPSDDFLAANIPDHKWDAFTVEEKLKNVLD